MERRVEQEMGENSFAAKYLSDKFGIIMLRKGEFIDSTGTSHTSGNAKH